MKHVVNEILDHLFANYPKLLACRDDITAAFKIMKDCYEGGGKILVCGNGGSAADSEHIVGELMKGFKLKRGICDKDADMIRKAFPENSQFITTSLQRAIPAISLVSQTSLISAYVNDVSAEMVFAQQVYGYYKDRDITIGLSTSGNAANVLNAIRLTKALGGQAIGFTGESGGKMKAHCDVTIKVPADETYMVQEYHLPVYHALCAMIEAEIFA